jgi:hypothetical protein
MEQENILRRKRRSQKREAEVEAILANLGIWS